VGFTDRCLTVILDGAYVHASRDFAAPDDSHIQDLGDRPDRRGANAPCVEIICEIELVNGAAMVLQTFTGRVQVDAAFFLHCRCNIRPTDRRCKG
jgi:hypothetical protein